MKKEDTEERDLLPILKVVFIVLLILCAVLLSVFLLVWTAKRTKPEPIIANQDTVESSEEELNITEPPVIEEEPEPTESPVTEEKFDTTEAPVEEEEPEAVIPEKVEENTDLGLIFAEVNEVVTAKDATNLRDIPSQGGESTIIVTLQNGQTATRIGVSEAGWSKLEYNGEICYAVSSLLTTDLTAKPQEIPEDDGIKTVFTDCNEKVCPKIEVNLRTLPSVTNPNSEVVATIRHGDIVTRTGINTDVGWSRIEYGGQTLYCVSSYVYVVEE